MTKSGSAPSGDRRVRRTRATLRRALIDLVEERDLPRISVADIVERAEVSRSTFYDHYRDVHELAEAACTSMIDDLIGFVLALDPAHVDPADSTEAPDPQLTAFFAHFAEHAGLYRGLLGPTGSARVIEHVRLRTTAAAHSLGELAATDESTASDPAAPSDTPHDVPAAFVAGALIGVATDWLRRGCPRTPSEMALLTKPLLRAAATGTCVPPTP
ncbi:TetR/AcrR family transcriptional regulator [Streptomyces sp. NPDC002643]